MLYDTKTIRADLAPRKTYLLASWLNSEREMSCGSKVITLASPSTTRSSRLNLPTIEIKIRPFVLRTPTHISRLQWVCLRRAACRNVAGDQRDSGQDQRDDDERQRVGGLDAVEQVGQKAGQS